MRKRILSSLLIGCLFTTAVWAQGQSVVEETKLYPNDEIVIQLEGRVTIETWASETLKVEAVVQEKGRTVGFTNKDKRGPYALQLAHSDGQVTVRPKPRADLYTVGINWYREHVEHRVWVPMGARVRVHVEEADLTIRGALYTVLASLERGDIAVVVQDRDVRVLQSSVEEGKVVVNGDKMGDTYQAIGTGERVYMLTTKKGIIDVQRQGDRS